MQVFEMITLFIYFLVHHKTADLTREGGSIPITLTLQEATGASVMMLPIGSSDDGAHSQNEKLNVSNYLCGVRGDVRVFFETCIIDEHLDEAVGLLHV